MTTIRRILLAEDELIVARVLQKVFEQSGYQVYQVSDGGDVISAVGEFKPDLIILDVHLRNKSSGIQAGRSVRQQGFTGPLLFVTGNSFDQTLEEIRDITNAHLFIKPVDSHQLIRYIQKTFP
ncbi:MAG TPA: response regulator [Bacteroidia bacterium]|nr:response regulator [Bacteroidia bacterium]